jgi:hypothetical protein
LFRLLLLLGLSKVTGKSKGVDRRGNRLLRGRAATQSDTRFRRLLESGMGTREAEEEMLGPRRPAGRRRRPGAGTP